MKITVEVPIEQGEVIAQALERASERADSVLGIEFTGLRNPSSESVRDSAAATTGNGWYAQQADALVAIAKDYLSGGSAGDKPTPAADHYQVVIHADRSALHGGIGRSDMAVETVKRLACDGSLITIVENEQGNPLDVGRKRRTVTTALRRALWARDRPDGRVIPRFGYRLDDIRDDDLADAAAAEPSTEVREAAAIYFVRRRAAPVLLNEVRVV
jgi:hypothetical protein